MTLDRDWDANLEDERVVELDDDSELPVGPPTIDPDERIESEERDA